MRRNSARFHDGTPAKAVTRSDAHSRQMRSTFSSKSASNAVSRRGVRNQPLQKRSSLDQQRRQVAYDDSAALRTGAPERQGLPLEYPCRGILPHVEGRHVAQPPRVAAPQRDVGDGQVFAPLGGRARRTGEPPHPAGRRDIGLARHHPLDVGFERRVIEPLHPLRERFGRADLPETVPSSELGSCAFAQQPFEFFALRLGGTTPEPFDRTAAQREKKSVKSYS